MEPAEPGRPGASTTAPEVGEKLIGIGQLVRVLGAEFKDLSISKVRYLEDRGLLRPRRTAGGYRKYAPSDIRRLRSILTLQRDEFLPLEVIRERIDRGTGGAVGNVLSGAAPLEAPRALQREEEELPWSEAVETAGVPDAFMRQLAEYRLIERPAGVLDPTLSETDVQIARVADLLARYGLEPRNLRLLQSAVEREAALLEQIVGPSLRSAHVDRKEMGEKTLLDLGTLVSRLKDLLLYKELREVLKRY